jgi:single-strand DNA-binding protein
MNQVNLVGRVARDVELRHSKNGKAYMFITVACDGHFDKKTGETRSDFIPITVWGKEAEKCKALLKGSLIRVFGRLTIGKFEKNGKVEYPMDVVGDQVTFLGKPRGKEEGHSLEGFSS